jgi:glycosyltransferase involved in cell wall biosynthesis
MRISVVVCTYNRCESLERTLKSFMEISTPEGSSWELILVDNNPKDKTKSLVEEFKKDCKLNIEYIFEEKPGLSHARNQGIKQAKGEIIAFTDDDAIVDRYWLLNIQKAFKEYGVSCVGGKILPIWEIPKPKWLIPELHYIVALLDRGDKPFYLESPIIWGTNFAVKASVFEKYGVFDVRLGRIPERLFAGEETDFVRRLLNEDEKVLYYPNAVVHHCVPRDRISKKYFRRWKYDQGILKASTLDHVIHQKYWGMAYHPIIYLLKNLIPFPKGIRNFSQKGFVYELNLISYIGFILQRIRNNKLGSKSFETPT